MSRSDLPPVSAVRSMLESLLLVSDEPVRAADAAIILSTEDNPVSSQDVTRELHAIADEFDLRGSGFELRHQEGLWRLYTRRENSAVVEKKLLHGTHQKLSRAALETLAVIAYRQPCTRAHVAGVRGVNCDSVIRTLMLRGFIKETGENAGARLYSTTELFLEQLGLETLDQLPDLAPLLPEVEDIDDDVHS